METHRAHPADHECEQEACDGIKVIKLGAWRDFFQCIRENFQPCIEFIFRGQRCASWALEPSLDRAAKKADFFSLPTHLESFQYAARGRRGQNPQELKTSESWWALGQHYGLATPLLDWTESPFLALYFTFAEEQSEVEVYEPRAVFALKKRPVLEIAEKIREQHGDAPGRPDTLEIISPLTDENSRLVNQRGLFTETSSGTTVEQWVETHFSKSKETVLFKIDLPEVSETRDEVLKELNLMNINALTLFPDLIGAAEFSNTRLRIRGY